eukprot:6242661-Pyramimonas_sp.AAC.1
MIAAAVAMLTTTKARPVRAPALITPTTTTASSRRRRAVDARDWPARFYLTWIVPPLRARKGARMMSARGARCPFGRIL